MPNLTIYLVREDFEQPQAAIAGLVNEFPVFDGDKSLGTLYVKDMPERLPPWVQMFAPFTDGLTAKTRATSALYLTRVEDRIFAVAFGHGRHLLQPGAVEDRFGLLVVINSLRSDQLRSIDKRTFDTVDQNVRAQVSQQSSATEFGIDIERDLIRAITGAPSDERLGLRMSGADSLVVSVDCTIPHLQELLSRYLAEYRSEAYKDGFAWIDQIKQVPDNTTLKADLDTKLVERMIDARDAGGHAPDLWLALPEVIDYTGVHRFRFTGRNDSYNDLHLPGFIQSLQHDEEISVDLLKKKQAIAVNEDGYPVGDKWPVYKCIHFEVTQGENTYLLATGKWFCIKKDFSDEVDEFYSNIPMIDLGWIEYEHDSEGAYNKAVHASTAGKYALMDAVPIAVGGVRDKVEFCDLYSDSCELVHVKRYGSSGVLGHLFNQGLVSGELLRMDEGFLGKVNDKICKSHKITLPNKPPRDIANFTIVFAIISEDQSEALKIPFFAKVALKHVHTRLTSLGYDKIKLSKIKVNDTYRKTLKPKRAARKSNKETKSLALSPAGQVKPLVSPAPLRHQGKKLVKSRTP